MKIEIFLNESFFFAGMPTTFFQPTISMLLCQNELFGDLLDFSTSQVELIITCNTCRVCFMLSLLESEYLSYLLARTGLSGWQIARIWIGWSRKGRGKRG